MNNKKCLLLPSTVQASDDYVGDSGNGTPAPERPVRLLGDLEIGIARHYRSGRGELPAR